MWNLSVYLRVFMYTVVAAFLREDAFSLCV